ncbi:amidase [Candidimonas nitroreducens]|uniref:Asp-tRNA(Asn)/Glu-tRNA(Gln) amidotransferase GatCAB subunit A n=1 Tax=Candidimonas nitroreducens TaxID=683354 RepID=A0A225LYG4_9BURK|nr:amidase [Candidimonas nitroreducens]OWT53572.1 Asp-tRNA(Asn)/Glu-tRNA(Gln) amidotransferase GatCAB subunit A [Candidimonas nitroreducens]
MSSADSDATSLDLVSVSRLIASGALRAQDVLAASLDRIDAWQPSRNCFIRLDRDAALARAQQCDRLREAGGAALGPLHGVPLAHKDLFYRTGEVSTGGSAIRRNWRADRTATVLARLDAAGAIQVGTLNMSEFAANPTGHNGHYGHCRNAWNKDYIAGGSSSGSATAVAARLVYAALGSDTGGSVRVPAAANGVLGLKPTYGRVSRYGCMPRFWSLDHIGVLARSAADCALVLGLIAGGDTRDATASARPVPDYLAQLDGPIKGIRVGVPDMSAISIDPQVQGALDASLEVLKGLGAVIVPLGAVDMEPMFRIAELIGKCEAASMHRPWLGEYRSSYTPQVLSRSEAGFFVPVHLYLDALRLRPRLLAQFLRSAMGGVDVLHMPVLPDPVQKIADLDAGANDARAMRIRAQMNLLTRPVNLLGLPALSVPAGFCRAGLPLAFQLLGHPFQEGKLLHVAHAFEQATGFHEAAPVL